jgi:TolB-like protein/class 3 adenylate cyclase
MAAEIKQEIAHVLFIDIVAYSKMSTDDQRAAVEELIQIVQATDEFRKEESGKRLLKIATGDGMALIFYHSPEDPVECALEISRGLREQHPELRVRMGVNSGPVSGVVDVNGRANVAGAGINVAQRVMNCGDAGHILLSRRVAEDLEQFKHWRPHLYDLGECEVKHGEKISVVNLFTTELGNRQLPSKFAPVAAAGPTAQTSPSHRKYVLIGGAVVAVIALGLLLFKMVGTPLRGVRQTAVAEQGRPSGASLPIPEKSIAVLPFENFSADKENAFFADGVQDDILTALAKVADLKVISRTSVMSYAAGAKRNLREIAQALGVAHILEGSVRRAGGKVRVTAQLIDARSDAHLWADTYDRDLADVFAIQSEIAKTIADQLQAKLSPKEKAAIEQPPTADVSAFDLYTRAKNLLLTLSFSTSATTKHREAVDLLNQAIARDPQFFLAYCQLASLTTTFTFSGWTTPPHDWPWQKMRFKPRSVCARMQEKHILPAPKISIVDISITIRRSLSLPSRAKLYRMILASSSWRGSLRGGEATMKRECITWNVRLSSIREILSRSSKLLSATFIFGVTMQPPPLLIAHLLLIQPTPIPRSFVRWWNGIGRRTLGHCIKL